LIETLNKLEEFVLDKVFVDVEANNLEDAYIKIANEE
jgi:hypothetical protein